MAKKDIIDELFQKRSDFNDPDQAETMSNLLDTVSSDIYSESQRFVFELIQNADDAAKVVNNEVHFEFYNNCLIVSHNGQPFSSEDIRSLTSAGSSTKKADTTKTGYKGIGFKSVFGKSERVTIFSDGFQFRFDKSYFKTILPWQIIPIWTELSDLPRGIQDYVSKNKYTVSTIIEFQNIELLQNDLIELLSNGQILLFLRRVSKISVSKDSRPLYSIEKKVMNEEATFNEVSLLKNEKEISSWITKIFENIPVPEKTRRELKQDEKTPKKLKESEFTEISFAAKIDGGKIRALKEGESLIFTYLPTKVDSLKFPFLVNGSFLTNAAREGIHEDKVWNQWLFELIAEKIFDWLSSLSTSKYKYQILHLLPHKFNNQQNELKRAFDNSFLKYCSRKKFIITANGNVSKTSEVVLDKTGLSNQEFIDPKSIIEFLKSEKKIFFSDDCFVNTNVEEVNKLKAIGVETFELDSFETFFCSTHFTSRHKVIHNYSLIKYFKEKSDNDKQGIWFQTLKNLAFIYDENEALCNPSNGICFPTGISSTELGNIPIIHPTVFDSIQKDKIVYEWLKKLGIKEPSLVAYVTNVIIPNIKKENFINNSNFLRITHYLFRLFKDNQLDEEVLESLRELKLKTKGVSLIFKEAQFCFLSNKYQPQLKIEGVIKDVHFVSEEYLFSDSNELEWNLFFKAIKVKDRVEVETINQNNSLMTLKSITDQQWIDECKQKAESGGGFGFGSHNVISSVKIPSFLNLTSSNIAYSRLFWKNIIPNLNSVSDLTSNAVFKYGVGYGLNGFSSSVGNYFPWFIKNKDCIPTTTKEILNAEVVFINDKEIKEIAGSYLPVFDFDEPLPDDWRELFRFRSQLSLNDNLTILSAIVQESEKKEDNDSKFKPPIKRIGLIYNKLASLISDMTAEKKQIISDWATKNKLLSINGNFESAVQLKRITIEGFSIESNRLKVIQLPENSNKNSETFKELLSLFQIQTIDKFIPLFDRLVIDGSLKSRLETILPYYVALIEKKKLVNGSLEFDRIYQLLNETDFFTTSEIKLSFIFESETFDGPSLSVYRADNKFYFKGKWKSERTLLSLIKELSNLLGVYGLNEELRFLLLETDINEVHEWLIEQGISLTSVNPAKTFTKKVIDKLKTEETEETEEAEEIISIDTKIIEIAEEVNIKIEAISESFRPTTPPNSFDVTKISAKTKTFIDATMTADANYAKIQSQEVREDVGRWSEEFVFEYLTKKENNFTEILWMNKDSESGMPYDFKVIENGIEKYIDVKGTPSGIKDIIYLSPNEWVFMFEKGENYSIYRVYNAGDDARIEIVENPSSLLQQGKIFPNPITLQI